MEKINTAARRTKNWKVLPILLALVFSLVGFSFSPQAAFAQQDQQQTQTAQAETISLGKVGVFSPQGFNEDTFSISKVDPRRTGLRNVDFVLPLVRISSTEVDFPNVLTYVFFNVRRGSIERGPRSLRDEGVGIWFRSNDGGTWQRCANTLVVNDRTAAQMGMNLPLQRGGETRVACVVTAYNATYGVGVERPSDRDND